MALSVGTRLGPYSVTAFIGEGGMEQVYRARDTILDRDVALKVLPVYGAGDWELEEHATKKSGRAGGSVYKDPAPGSQNENPG